MQIQTATLETCSAAAGTVVAIDVIRAFTTAAVALATGACDIVLAGTVEEALALRERLPGALVMGEVDGLKPPGFDFSNSPAELARADLAGRRLIQRTSAGVQGIVRSIRAERLLATSFVCAGATARYLRQQAPAQVTLVVTGIQAQRDGDEDAACADYLTALLQGQTPDSGPFIERLYRSSAARLFADPAQPDFPAADLPYCAAIDRFDFALPVERRDGLLVMEAMLC